MRNFLRSERGYVLVLTLIFMPVFVGIGLLVIDIGRGNNAQQDHQAAADALALAGARELDGKSDSVVRAKAAMSQAALTNSVSFVTLNPSTSTQTLQYTAGSTTPFNVIFLKNIPASDDTPIDATYASNNVANTGDEARYVYVFSRTSSLRTFFFNPLTRSTENFPVGAVAVATLNRSTCDLAPIYLCNPYEGLAGKTPKERLLEAFGAGNLYGRMVKLSVNQKGSTAGPGNIGYLRTSNKNGAPQLAEALAGVPYPECVNLQPTVETQPGEVTSAAVGFNTRFDIFAKAFGGTFSRDGDFTPALNVRKGWLPKGGGPPGNTCVTNPATPDYSAAPVFSDNRDPATDLGPGLDDIMRTGPWNLAFPIQVNVQTSPSKSTLITYPSYWQRMYSAYPNIRISNAATEADLTATDKSRLRAMIKTDPSASATRYLPSRYDVYNYELTHDTNGNVVSDPTASLASIASPGGELGLPQCYTPKQTVQPTIDRRTMFVAIIDCSANGVQIKGGAKEVPVDALAKVFLVNPLDSPGNDPGSQSVDFEFVDVIDGSGGGAEEYLREDVVLVR